MHAGAESNFLSVKLAQEEEALAGVAGLIAELTSGKQGGTSYIDAEVAKLTILQEAHQKVIDKLGEEIEVRLDSGQSATDLQEKLAEEEEALAGVEEQITKLTSVNRHYADLMASVGGDVEKFRVLVEAETATLEAAEKATADMASAQSKFADMAKDLNDKRLTGLDAELERLKLLHESYAALLDQQQDQAEAQLKGIEVQKARAMAIADEESRKRQLAVLAEKQAEAEGKLAEVQDLRAKNAKRHAEDEKKARQEAADAARKEMEETTQRRRDYVRDQEIQRLKQSGDNVAATRLENEKILEAEKRRMDEIFKLDGVNNAKILEQRKKAEADLQKRLDERMRAAQEAAAKEDKHGLSDVADRSVSLETEITGQLAKQVKSVADMLMLYQGIFIVRNAMEQRALAAADFAARAEFRLIQLKRRRAEAWAKGQNTDKLDLDIMRAEKQVEVLKAIGDKREAEANLGRLAGKDMERADAETTAKLKDLETKMAVAHGNIQGKFGKINVMFGDAPATWVASFMAGWAVEAPKLAAAVEDAMQQVLASIAATAQASQNMMGNLGGVATGATDLLNFAGGLGTPPTVTVTDTDTGTGGMIQPSAPALSGGVLPDIGGAVPATFNPLAGMSMQEPVPVDSGGQEPVTNIEEMNDNRAVSIEVNNNVDLDELQRVIGSALEQVNMGYSGEV